MKNLVVFVVFLAMIASAGCSSAPEKIIGIKIYEYKGDFDTLVGHWKEMGINTAFVSKELATSPDFRKALTGKGIKVFVIFPVFYNPEALQHDSTLYAITDKGRIAKDDWVEFVCPSRKEYRDAKAHEVAALVNELNPDGISIDFIREFVFWEKIYHGRTAQSIDRACFCDNCVQDFCRQRGIFLPDTCVTTVQKAGYLLSKYAAAYDSFRCDLIASMAERIAREARDVRPDLKINIHLVPWREEDFGDAGISVAAQDLRKLARHADYLSPMCYSQMLRRDSTWISSVVADMDRKAPGMILPSIQVYPYYIEDPFTPEDFRRCIRAALKPPSMGVVFWSWPLFEKDTVRMGMVRKEVKN
jgi:hypothetical protein